MNIVVKKVKKVEEDIIIRRKWEVLLTNIISISEKILDSNNNDLPNLTNSEFIKNSISNNQFYVNIANTFNNKLNTIIKQFKEKYVVNEGTAIDDFITSIKQCIENEASSVSLFFSDNQRFSTKKKGKKQLANSFELADTLIQDCIAQTLNEMYDELNNNNIEVNNDKLQRIFVDKIKLLQLFLKDIQKNKFYPHNMGEQSKQARNIMQRVFDEKYIKQPNIEAYYVQTLEYMSPQDVYYDNYLEWLKKLIGLLKSYMLNKYKQKNKEKEEENIVIFNDDENRNNDIILNNGLIGKNKKAILSALPNKNFKAKLRQKIKEFKQHIQGCTVSKITKAHFLKFESLFNGLYQSFITRVNDKNMASTNTTAFIDGLVMPLVQSNLSSVENSEEVQKQIDSIKQQLDESAKNFLNNFTAIDNNEKFHEQFYNFINNVISVLKTCVDSYDKIISINIPHRNIEPIIENEESEIEENSIEESENSKSENEEENKESNEESEIEESKNEDSKNSKEKEVIKEAYRQEENSNKESKNEYIKIDESIENSEKDIEKDNNIEKEKENEEKRESEENIESINKELTKPDQQIDKTNINNKQKQKLINIIKQNKNRNIERNIQSDIRSVNHQHLGLDNKNKPDNRPKSAVIKNKTINIDNIDGIMQQYNNVGNVVNVVGTVVNVEVNENEQRNNNIEHINQNENINNQQENENDETYCNNIINNVTNKGSLDEGTDLQRFINCYRRNNNILTHKSAIFWLNAEERRNNALLDFINNDAKDNNLENLKTLNDRLRNIRGGKCSWCGGD